MNQIPKLSEVKYLNIEYIFSQIFEGIKYSGSAILKVYKFLDNGLFKTISFSLCALLLIGIIFVLFRIFEMNKKKIISGVEIFAEDVPEKRTERWSDIKKRINSENISDWKIAIMDADSLIDEIVQKIGYRGGDLGERLAKIEQSDFENLQNVWEAHKIRNRIAHDGDKFQLTKDIVKSTFEKYEKALKELKYI